MAVTSVYATIVRVNVGGGQSEDNHIETNISTTTAAFNLKGGQYGITVVGATFGTLTLQILGGDGTTWLSALNAAFAASGSAAALLMPGQYRWVLA
jgi:hypothetical protein